MKASRKAKRIRGLYDIHSAQKAEKFSGDFHEFTVNLRPSFYKKHRLAVLVAAVFIAVAAGFGARKLLTKAEVADFYPSTCLGTWQNPSNAQGKPETLGVASSSFTDANSARYEKSVSAGENRIFCGGFLPSDFQPRGTLTGVGLTLVWQVSTTTPAESAAAAPASAANANGISSSTVPNIPTSTEQSPQPTSTPPAATSTERNSSSSASLLFKLFSRFFQSAFADEASSTADSSSAAPLIQNSSAVNTPSSSNPAPAPPDASSSPSSSASGDSSSSISATGVASAVGSSSEAVTTTDSNPPPTSTPVEHNQTSTENFSATSSGASSTESASSSTAAPAAAPAPPDQNFLKISYSTDGQNWLELQKVGLKNWSGLSIGIPLSNWDDVKKLQIQIEEIPAAVNPLTKLYLDGMLLEVHYDVPPLGTEILGNSTPAPAAAPMPSAERPVIVLPPEQKPVPLNSGSGFKADESPSFDLDLDSLPVPASTTSTSTATSSVIVPSSPLPPTNGTSAPQSYNANPPQGRGFSLLGFFLRIFGFEKSAAAGVAPPNAQNFPDAGNPIVSKILDPGGKETSFSPTFITAGSRLRITLPEPGREFVPGRYTLELWLFRNGVIYFTSSSFDWGVLAVNFNKSIYAPGDTAKMGFAVLDEQGHTLCDASVEMTVVSPSGKTEFFSTANKKISKNPTCGPQTVTNNPDYSAEIAASEQGIYRIDVVAKTRDGARRITDGFTVQNEPAFDAERLGPTRIYPPADYAFTIRVKANQNFSGQIAETVPASFNVSTELASQKISSGDSQEIIWNVNLNKGDSINLAYSFRAPNISPKLYKLGPLQIGSWQEARQWQIAADAAGDIILLWDRTSGNIPSGWTCLNCVAGDPFYGVYPRASSSYGTASSSADTVQFSLTFNNASSGATQAVNSSANKVVTLNTHTHTWSNLTSNATNIRPFSKNLYFISTASTTAVLPAGVIGMFDVASTSSLPAYWTAYDPLNSSTTTTYLRGGENTTSTVGSTTHAAIVASWTSGSASTSTASVKTTGTAVAAGAAGQTHTQAQATLATEANNPSYVGVVFAKLSANSGAPNGLIAMFNNTSLPNNWSIISGAGTAYSGSLLVGTSTFANSSSGVTTYNETGGYIYTSGIPDTTSTYNTGTATSLSSGTHTHQVAYTIASVSAFPVYRDVILGKYAAPATTISCAASTSTVNFGTIDSNSVYTSPNASTSMSCTGALGCTLYENDVGSTAKPGLYKSASPTYLISSPDSVLDATATLAAGTDGYGIQAATTTAGSNGTLTLGIRYLQSGNTVGGLTTTTLAIASSTAPVTNREVVITHMAAVSNNALAGSYADTITYSCLSN